MAYHTENEEKELNAQLKKWQKRQLTAARQNYFDYVCEIMTETERAIWAGIAKAKSYKDVNWLMWNLAYDVIDKYCKIARKGARQ